MSSDKSPKRTNRRSFVKFLGVAGIGVVAGIGLAESVFPLLAPTDSTPAYSWISYGFTGT